MPPEPVLEGFSTEGSEQSPGKIFDSHVALHGDDCDIMLSRQCTCGANRTIARLSDIGQLFQLHTDTDPTPGNRSRLTRWLTCIGGERPQRIVEVTELVDVGVLITAMVDHYRAYHDHPYH